MGGCAETCRLGVHSRNWAGVASHVVRWEKFGWPRWFLFQIALGLRPGVISAADSCACYLGVVYIGHMVEADDGGEVESMRLYRAAGATPPMLAKEKGRTETGGAYSEGVGR